MKPHSRVTFFIDDALGAHALSRKMREMGYDVRVLLEEVGKGPEPIESRNEDDEVWIPKIARKGWIILTSDKARFRPLQGQVFLSAKAAAFILTANKLNGEKLAEVVVKALPKIEKMCLKGTRPILGKITGSSQVELTHGGRRGGVKHEEDTDYAAADGQPLSD